MPLYTLSQTTIAAIDETSFVAAGFKERADLQRLLRDNPGVIASDILVIAEEFGNWDKSQRRIDLLALDKDANLVVVELKRDTDGAHMELQALRYAAMVGRMTFDQAVDTYGRLLASRGNVGTQDADPRSSILKFLEWDEPNEDAFAQDVRIVLASADFSQEIITTVLWLNDHGLDIRCVRLKPYLLASSLLLNVEQIVPLPEAADYQIQIRLKKQEERAATHKQRAELSLDVLVNEGLLCPGTRLHLVRLPRASLNITDEKAKRATFEAAGRQGIKWDYDNKYYSLSGLCRVLCETFGATAGAGAFRGPDYWGIEGDAQTLTDRASSRSSK